MKLKEALGEIQVSRLARRASQAPAVNDRDDIAAACIYEAQAGSADDISDPANSAKIVAVTRSGDLLLISWAGSVFEVEFVPSRTIAVVLLQASQAVSKRGDQFVWTQPELNVELEGGHHRVFPALPFEGFATKIHDSEQESSTALMRVAETLCGTTEVS